MDSTAHSGPAPRTIDDLRDRTAVVTGGASGIGFELASRFGAAGMNVVLADIEQPALSRAAEDLAGRGVNVMAHELDVRNLDEIEALAAATRERFGNVHVLCNNAGVGTGGPVSSNDDIELWKWTIDINLWGVIYGCKVFAGPMAEHGELAHIVNTASMAGLGSAPFMGAYNVSKYGVVALSETLSKEMLFAGSTLGVSVLCPAFVKTGIANSRRNLPSELDVDPLEPQDGDGEGMSDLIQSLVDGGIPTSVVGDAVLDAIVENRFWILTHPESLPGITARADQIVNGVNPVMDFGGGLGARLS